MELLTESLQRLVQHLSPSDKCMPLWVRSVHIVYDYILTFSAFVHSSSCLVAKQAVEFPVIITSKLLPILNELTSFCYNMGS